MDNILNIIKSSLLETCISDDQICYTYFLLKSEDQKLYGIFVTTPIEYDLESELIEQFPFYGNNYYINNRLTDLMLIQNFKPFNVDFDFKYIDDYTIEFKSINSPTYFRIPINIFSHFGYIIDYLTTLRVEDNNLHRALIDGMFDSIKTRLLFIKKDNINSVERIRNDDDSCYCLLKANINDHNYNILYKIDEKDERTEYDYNTQDINGFIEDLLDNDVYRARYTFNATLDGSYNLFINTSYHENSMVLFSIDSETQEYIDNI